ncbi:NAD(P)/FAD-dependent oxidoreductase [Planctomycetota bacterium]
MGIGYQSPKYVRAVQIELARRPDAASHAIDDYIRMNNISGKKVRQLVLTPKGNFATLTLLSPHDMQIKDLLDIRYTEEVENILKSGWQWPKNYCFCLPYIVKRSAKNFYGDRVVLIGNAACCRYFKNGLESALRSAGIAAQTALHHGISRQCFRRWYYPQVWREIIHDNLYERFLLWAHNLLCSHPFLMRLAIQACDQITRPKMIRHQKDILWDILTGNRSYRHIFFRIINPQLLLDSCMHLLQVLTQKLYQSIIHLGRRCMFWKEGYRSRNVS